VSDRRQLLFVSPRFLFPVDSGGKIRTTQILRGMKGGRFEITLASPAPADAQERFRAQLDSVCDHFVSWPEARRLPGHSLWRLRHVAGSLPIPVATDRSHAGSQVVAQLMARRPDVAVFDFPHAHVLAQSAPGVARVMFTHNVEAEIFRRHAEVAGNPALRWLWNHQFRRMQEFEGNVLRSYDTVVAVSARDAAAFKRDYGLAECRVIDTGVDLDYFAYREPPEGHDVVFSGSMDWLANADGIRYFLDEVWSAIVAQVPQARMLVVGRTPPADLVELAKSRGVNWEFTGFVDDVRDYLHRASAYVIPLRVGGGTRLKVFEAMASGSPVVSTSIGVEGLPVEPGVHYLRGDDAQSLASGVVRLLRERGTARQLARTARAYVEERFSFQRVARQFESFCDEAADRLQQRGTQPEARRRTA
jgi:glycosyltransferase involved in cell wall biosynthesis